LNGTAAESTKAVQKILAMVKALPGVLSADAAWGAGGNIIANFRASEGTPVDGTAATIRRMAAGVGAQIRAGVTVTVVSTSFTSTDIVRTAAVAPVAPEAAPLAPDVPAPVTESPGPATYDAPGSGMSIWPFAVGGGVLILGAAAYFLLRKKKTTQLTVRAA
jgi:LPXTG-motif cell wall-anchored protein